MRPRVPVFFMIFSALIAAAILLQCGLSAAQSVGPEFRVNTAVAGDQANSAVAMNSSGDFVVAWESAGQDGSGLGVFARRFSASGEKVGPEFRVNTFTAGDQWFAAVAMRDDGAFLIAWQSAYQDGDGRGVFAQLFSPGGDPVGPEFQVNTTTYSNQAFPDAAVNPETNGFVITWSSAFQDEVHDAVIARLFDAEGSPVTDEFVVNQHTLGFQGYSRVGCDASGKFVLAYTSWLIDGDSWGIGARRYLADGSYADAEFLVNEYFTLAQDYPDVAVSPGAGFVIAWHSQLQDGYGYGIYHRRYDGQGHALGGEIPVNMHVESNQWYPKIAADGFGSYTIVWQSDLQDGSGRGVYARRYRSDGEPHTSEFRVNTYTAGNQEKPVVACDAMGNSVVVWQSQLQDGSGLGIYAQRFAAGTVPVAFSLVTAEVLGEAVRVRWDLTGDAGPSGYNVYRRSEGDFARIAGLLVSDAFEYVDESVQPGDSYVYRVGLVDGNGEETLSLPVDVTVPAFELRLLQNSPNPFASRTGIEYALDRARVVDVTIYDARGVRVWTLESTLKNAGRHAVEWDGRDGSGEPVSSGVYFCRIEVEGRSLAIKMVCVR